ncbi:MAG: family 20 glycosylhydrolase, partial [Cyclobacteriaceae bacterium]
EVIRPLTDSEKDRILGGEACQWSEFVDSVNINSRIWPRAAAIGEKLWTASVLTEDINDMYRRLDQFKEDLAERGMNLDSIYENRLKSLADNGSYEDLKAIMDIMEEVKYHGRMPGLLEKDELYLPDYPLNRLVDIARPESPAARKFSQQVKEENQAAVLESLRNWNRSATELEPYLSANEFLQDLDSMNHELKLVTGALIEIREGGNSQMGDSLLLQKLNYLESGEHGLILAVVPAFRELME